MREEAHSSLGYADDGDAEEGLGTNVLIDNPPEVNISNENVNKFETAVRNIQLDLASFTFGLSELYMLTEKRGELSQRIILLKKCVDESISKVDKLLK
jgi:hypothetical protein